MITDGERATADPLRSRIAGSPHLLRDQNNLTFWQQRDISSVRVQSGWPGPFLSTSPSVRSGKTRNQVLPRVPGAARNRTSPVTIPSATVYMIADRRRSRPRATSVTCGLTLSEAFADCRAAVRCGGAVFQAVLKEARQFRGATGDRHRSFTFQHTNARCWCPAQGDPVHGYCTICGWFPQCSARCPKGEPALEPRKPKRRRAALGLKHARSEPAQSRHWIAGAGCGRMGNRAGVRRWPFYLEMFCADSIVQRTLENEVTAMRSCYGGWAAKAFGDR